MRESESIIVDDRIPEGISFEGEESVGEGVSVASDVVGEQKCRWFHLKSIGRATLFSK